MQHLARIRNVKRPILILCALGCLLVLVPLFVWRVQASTVTKDQPSASRSAPGVTTPQGSNTTVPVTLARRPTPTPKPIPTPTPVHNSAPMTNSDPGTGITSPALLDSTGTVYRITVPSQETEEFGIGTYVLWIPKGVSFIRGVTTWGPACGGSDLGTGIPNPDGVYLGNKYHLGVIGQSLTHKDGTRNCHETYADLGSGAAFLRALNQFATVSNHAELANAPIVVEGLSVAGGWATRMLQAYPDRIIACYARATTLTGETVIPAVTTVPVMLSVGSNDSGFLDGTRTSFTRYRTQNGPWSFLLIPGEGHTWNSNSTNMMTLYLDEIIPLRLPATPGNPLLQMNTAKGWLGNVATGDIMPIEQYSGDRLQAAWFPNQRAAIAWQKMTTTGKLSAY